jgi:uncharacterized membrane protein YbaN (DUF454 family)
VRYIWAAREFYALGALLLALAFVGIFLWGLAWWGGVLTGFLLSVWFVAYDDAKARRR